MIPEVPEYLRIAEAARTYNISASLLRKWIASRRLASIRPAGCRLVLIRRTDLDQLMTESVRERGR